MLDKIFGPFTRRWGWAATALRVQQRFGEVRGNFLAAAVALNFFIAIFPLLLVTLSIIGFVVENNEDFVQQVIDNLGLTGESARLFTDALGQASESKKATSIIGLLGLLWTGLGVVAAIEHALDATWQQTGRGIKDKPRGIVWGVGALIILGLSVSVTAGVDYLADGFALWLVSVFVAIAINTIFWMWTFLSLSYRRVHWKAYLPGAVLAAVGLEIIKQLTSLVPSLFNGGAALYGSIGAVFAILAALVLFARLVVYASVLNVIRWEEDEGTVTVEVDVPRMPGEVPLEGDRAGAVEPPVAGQ
jgi:membrane protein